MSEPTNTTFGDNKDTWRTGALLLGFALLISLAAHVGGPASANASDTPGFNELQRFQHDARQQLGIGGFTTLNDQPALIILNPEGQRVGTLPLSAAAEQQTTGND